MIGYYVHHVGRGHLSRATAIAAASADEVTILSSLPAPSDWQGPWLRLPRDDAPIGTHDPDGVPREPSVSDPDASAAGRLHWVPVGHSGLRARAARISAWIDRAAPAVLVADVSVEVALLARLHGVPVVSVALPGRRDDAAHRLGFGISRAILSAWPPEADEDGDGEGEGDGDGDRMLTGLDDDLRARHHRVGAISRFRPVEASTPADAVTPADRHGRTGGDGGPHGRRRVLVVNGAGGGGLSEAVLDRAARQTPDWEWSVLGGEAGRWTDDPWPLIRSADVVVTHAGQNAIAEVAAARRPAVVLPEPRPHDEQQHTARVLAHQRWPATVIDPARAATLDWADLLRRVADQDGAGWAVWNDGRGAERAAAVINRVARGCAP